jgi:hypothetical protein
LRIAFDIIGLFSSLGLVLQPQSSRIFFHYVLNGGSTPLRVPCGTPDKQRMQLTCQSKQSGQRARRLIVITKISAS